VQHSTEILIACALLVVAALAFFMLARGKSSMKIKGPGGMSVETKNESPAPVATVAQGITIKGAKAGANIVTENRGGAGGISLEDLEAGKDIRSTNESCPAPPKK
jgi:hypothetical protein